MKAEHNAIIERAKIGGYEPSMIAHELLVHDLVQAALFEFRNVRAPFHSLNEGQQQEVIDRVTEAAEKSVYNAISIISSRNVDTIPVTIVDAKFKAKAITVTAAIDAQDPNRHGLIDVAGRLCLLVLAPNDYAEGLDGIKAERDQPDLPLHVSDLTGSLFEHRTTGPDEPDGESLLGTAEELAQRTGGADDAGADLDKEFGEFTYDDAAQLIVLKSNNKAFKAHWIQSRLAIDTDKAASLLIRLLDNGVIQLEAEGDTAMDHSYKVVATLADVT
ncbi:MAG: DNA translocase FtsK [Pseudomonas sp.]|nr:DNA translocase FtsK [Pseudomonas sp.]